MHSESIRSYKLERTIPLHFPKHLWYTRKALFGDDAAAPDRAATEPTAAFGGFFKLRKWKKFHYFQKLFNIPFHSVIIISYPVQKRVD